MSSSVSPRQRDIGEVASLRAEGVDCQPQSGFVQLRVERPADWETYSYAQLNHKLSTITLLRNKKKRRTIEMRPFSNYGKTITILLHLQKYATNPGSVPMPDST